MCGIFGVIAPQDIRLDGSAARSLAILNRDRGKQALGYFDSEYNVHKKAKDPEDVVDTVDCTKFIDHAEENSWFIVGHTRFGTRGSNIDANAHPYRYGDYIGAHNGICDAPTKYDVDSMYLFDSLNENKGDYQKAFDGISGYWSLAWYDGQDLYLQMFDNCLALAEYNGQWYFSSDVKHLHRAIGAREYYDFKQGMTCKFSPNGDMSFLKEFEPTEYKKFTRDSRTSGRGAYYGGYSGNYSSSTSTTSTKDMDDEGWISTGLLESLEAESKDESQTMDPEFVDAWKKYESMTDDEDLIGLADQRHED